MGIPWAMGWLHLVGKRMYRCAMAGHRLLLRRLVLEVSWLALAWPGLAWPALALLFLLAFLLVFWLGFALLGLLAYRVPRSPPPVHVLFCRCFVLFFHRALGASKAPRRLGPLSLPGQVEGQ